MQTLRILHYPIPLRERITKDSNALCPDAVRWLVAELSTHLCFSPSGKYFHIVGY